jgi:hypothetical protein
MVETYTEILSDENEDAGIHRTQFSNAVSTWVWMQQRPITVMAAAISFNTTPDLIEQAVSDHYWMFLGGDADKRFERTIEHDGE